MAGLYLEDFEIGHVFQHTLRKTVTESDNMLFSVMTLNPQPLHIDLTLPARLNGANHWSTPCLRWA